MELLTLENLAALFALTSLEIVLGIDNVVFLAILVEKLEPAQRQKARFTGLMLAMVFRILLLLCISWIMLLTEPIFTIGLINQSLSGKNIILLAGGLFLLWKATHEIHSSTEHIPSELQPKRGKSQFWKIVAQIGLIDIVFSIDSVITAVGMSEHVPIMIIAIILAIIVMLAFAKRISDFIETNPTIKMLALSFLLLVGLMLVADGVGQHIPRGYLYFAMAFSLFVEVMNIKARKKTAKLRA